MYCAGDFAPEITFIKNPVIAEFTRFCLENAPPYFFEKASSSTGKYHSTWSNGSGGLVRHSRATAYVAKELGDAYRLTPDEKDAAIAAAILHDLCKYGLPGGPHTTKTHDAEAAKYVYGLSKRFAGGEVPLLMEICAGIAHHFGRWGSEHPSRPLKEFPEDYSRVMQVVHVADMIASRKAITFTFLEESPLCG